jgi:hypothetical protein
MGQTTSSRKRSVLVLALALGGVLAFAYGTHNRALAADAVKQQPSAQLVSLGMKFEGATGCNAVKCHGSPTANAAPKPAGNEYITWSEKDKHAEAFKSLSKPEAQKIADALKLGKADASAACLNCHALEVPANLQMAKFNQKEGVTCGACHGPYEKWADPHNKPSGANDLRAACGYKVLKADEIPYSTSSPEHQKLLKTYGLFDTRPILARAEKCTSCHLAIDSKLIDAGHPVPIFELAYYTFLENPHWREPGGYWATKVWAAGQVVCLRDAMNQLADRASGGASEKMVKDAYGQAMSHLLLFRYLTGGKAAAALDTAAKDLQAAGDDKAKLASAAKAAADAATSMMTPVGALVPAEGNTAALLGKIVGEADSATIGGFRGAQQQALALSTLCASYKSGKGAAGLDDVQKMIDENLLALVGDEAAFKAADYATALKAVAAKLTPMLPAGAAMPDAIDLK